MGENQCGSIQDKGLNGRVLLWQATVLSADYRSSKYIKTEVDVNQYSINAYADRPFQIRLHTKPDDLKY